MNRFYWDFNDNWDRFFGVKINAWRFLHAVFRRRTRGGIRDVRWVSVRCLWRRRSDLHPRGRRWAPLNQTTTRYVLTLHYQSCVVFISYFLFLLLFLFLHQVSGLSRISPSEQEKGSKIRPCAPARASGLRKKAPGKKMAVTNENSPGLQATISGLWKNFSFNRCVGVNAANPVTPYSHLLLKLSFCSSWPCYRRNAASFRSIVLGMSLWMW